MASQAYLTAGIAAGQAQKGRVDAMRIMAGCTFNIRLDYGGFVGYGIDSISAGEQI